jgi:hypothetical protein
MDLTYTIEAMENAWMRAWVARNARALKTLTSRRFRMVVASQPAVLLDANSWWEAATTRYLCTSYKFSDLYVRKLDAIAIFATRLELQATMDGHDWSGEFWVTDLWRKSPVRRKWQMLERHVSQPIQDSQVRPALRSLQLWR